MVFLLFMSLLSEFISFVITIHHQKLIHIFWLSSDLIVFYSPLYFWWWCVKRIKAWELRWREFNPMKIILIHNSSEARSGGAAGGGSGNDERICKLHPQWPGEQTLSIQWGVGRVEFPYHHFPPILAALKLLLSILWARISITTKEKRIIIIEILSHQGKKIIKVTILYYPFSFRT